MYSNFSGDLHAFRYLPMFIKEVMRFYSPVPMVARRSSSPTTLDGHIVPPNVRMDINLYAIHHSPDVWEDPEVGFPMLELLTVLVRF